MPSPAPATRPRKTSPANWAPRGPAAPTRNPPDALDAAIIFAPVGPLVPAALRAVGPGGVVVCAGIHMSDIPAFPYAILWGERVLRSVANLTRARRRGFSRAGAAREGANPAGAVPARGRERGARRPARWTHQRCGGPRSVALTPRNPAPSLDFTRNSRGDDAAMGKAIRERWHNGKGIINGWLAIPSGFAAEVMAQAGWDAVTVDIQHGVQDYQSMLACFQGIQPHGVPPLVRVPWNEPGIIGKVLDAGAQGRDLPDDQHPRPGRGLRLRLPLPAARHPQLRPDPRRHLRPGRRRLHRSRQCRDPRHADDRNARGDQQPRRHPRRDRGSTPFMSVPTISPSRSASPRAPTATSRSCWRSSNRSLRPRPSAASWRGSIAAAAHMPRACRKWGSA